MGKMRRFQPFAYDRLKPNLTSQFVAASEIVQSPGDVSAGDA